MLIRLRTSSFSWITDPIRKVLNNYGNANIIGLTSDLTILNDLHNLADRIPEEKIPLLAKDMISKLPDDKLHHLSDIQLPCLINSQISSTKNQELINRLGDTQLTFVPPDVMFSKLSKQRLRALQLEALIQKVPLDRISDLTKDQLANLSSEQLKPCTSQDVFDRLEEHQLENVDDLSNLSPKKVRSLTNSSLIQRLPHKHVKELTPNQIELLGDDQLNNLTPQQIKQIECDKVIHKLSKSAIKHLCEAQYVHLTSSQIKSLSVKKLSLLSSSQLDNISYSQRMYLTDIQTIRKLRGDHIKQLNPMQLRVIAPDQLTYATAVQKTQYIFESIIFGIISSYIELVNYAGENISSLLRAKAWEQYFVDGHDKHRPSIERLYNLVTYQLNIGGSGYQTATILLAQAIFVSTLYFAAKALPAIRSAT